jgi:hypothetical protein
MERLTLPYIADTVRPTLYHRHGSSYPISQTQSTLPYTMEQTALPYIKDTVHRTLYHIHGKPYLLRETVRGPLYHRHGVPYPISQTRYTLPYIVGQSALPYIKDSSLQPAYATTLKLDAEDVSQTLVKQFTYKQDQYHD